MGREEERMRQGTETTMGLDNEKRDQDGSSCRHKHDSERTSARSESTIEDLIIFQYSSYEGVQQREESFHERGSPAYFGLYFHYFSKRPRGEEKRDWRHQMQERNITGDQFISKVFMNPFSP